MLTDHPATDLGHPFLNDWVNTCDWGFCDQPSVGVRFCSDLGHDLSVCVHHLDAHHNQQGGPS